MAYYSPHTDGIDAFSDLPDPETLVPYIPRPVLIHIEIDPFDMDKMEVAELREVSRTQASELVSD